MTENKADTPAAKATGTAAKAKPAKKAPAKRRTKATAAKTTAAKAGTAKTTTKTTRTTKAAAAKAEALAAIVSPAAEVATPDIATVLSDAIAPETVVSETAPAEVVTPAPVIEPVAEPVVETVVEPVAATVAEPIAEPVVETITEPVVEPVPEAIIEPVAETAAEPMAEPVAEPVVEAIAEPTPESIVEPTPEPAPEATPEPEQAPEPEPVAEVAAPVVAPAPKVEKPSMETSRLLGITPRPLLAGNPYTPAVATVIEVIRETPMIVTLRVVIDDKEAMDAFTYKPGQVGQVSIFGVGEATFVINSQPSCKEYLQFSVMKTGEVTEAIHKLNVGDKVGVRAPLGNHFPCEEWKGKNVVFVGGGIGMAPIRTIMLHMLENKADYGKISLLYGARSPRDMAYSYELESWLANPDLDCNLCIDAPFEGWEHKVGMIPHVLTDMNPSAENTVAVLCGPPIMIKFTVQALEKLGFAPENIVTTLEKRMKCGIGICGRCNIGGRFVCVDGPVFTWAELKELPPDM